MDFLEMQTEAQEESSLIILTEFVETRTVSATGNN